jgi:hypothetical protein
MSKKFNILDKTLDTVKEEQLDNESLEPSVIKPM